MTDLAVLEPISRPAERPTGIARLGARSRAERRSGFFDEVLRDTPWKVRDLVRMVTRLGIGAVGLLISWIGSSGTADFRDQTLWLAGGAAATVLGAVAGSTWLLSGFGSVSRERRDLRLELAARLDEIAARSSIDDATAEILVSGEGMHRYHRRGCDLVHGKPVEVVTPAAITRKHLEPCGMCEP